MSPGLNEVRITAERVRRFADLVAQDPSEQHRGLWLAAMRDLDWMVARALESGVEADALRATCGEELWSPLGADQIAA
jgi:hypothetical protein